MTPEKVKRKLTAILSADVKGYSRLMGADEVGTIRILQTYRGVISDLIQKKGGRVVDSPGDNVLAEFSSVVDALESAVEIQRELKVRNADRSESRRMEFRIGINLGDVVEEGERIYGDGVNIAARIEGLADGGGICVSGTVFDQIGKRLPLGYEYMGAQAVKNIEKPIRVYRVLMEPESAGKVIGEKEPKQKKWGWKAVAAIAVLVLVAGGSVWNFYWRAPRIVPASKEKMAFPLPDKPSIAVLPFVNMSGDPSQDFLVDGITENIITALSGVSKLFVIARNSTFTYKGKPVKVQQVAEDLGVRYVLEGSIARSGDRIRVTAQLIDALKGHHLWAERYDREMKDIFVLQDDMAMKILRGVGLKLTIGYDALAGGNPKSLDVFLKILQAREYLRVFNIDDNNRARIIAEECMALEPDFWGSHGILGSVHMMDYHLGSTKNPAKSLLTAIEYLEKAVALTDDAKGRVYPTLGYLYSMRREYEKAIEIGERAIAIVPNGAEAHAWLAMSLNYAGRPQEAIPLFEKAIRLNPFPPAFYYMNFGSAYRLLGRLEEAVAMYKKTVVLSPNNIIAYVNLAGTCGLMGKEEEAKASAAAILRLNPKWSIEYYARTSLFKDKERVIEGLRKAGLPDKPPLPLPDKPSIAVLPFVNMSDDKSQEYFSDGLTEEIITALSKSPQLFVIASNTTFTYKGRSVNVRQVSQELGVRYILEGSVRKSGESVRITAQLIDAQKDHHVWSERYDRELKDLFSVQDDITKNVITGVYVKLTDGERARVFAKGTSNLEAYLKTSEAQWHLARFTKDGVLSAQRLAEEAITLDTNYAYAYMTLGSVHGYFLWLGMSPSPADSLKRCIELMQKAVVLDDSAGEAHALLAYWLVMARQYDKGVAECEKAIALDPNSDRVLHACAATLAFAGKREEAIPLFREALRLNPKPPNLYYKHFAVALRDSGKYDEAIELMKKAIERAPDDVLAYVVLASSYEMAGREEEARIATKEILRINPTFSLERLAKTSPHKDQAVVERFIEALRKAGLK